MTHLKIKVNTASNYKNCNGQPLTVIEFLGTMIAVEVPRYGFNTDGDPVGEMITADFNIKEVVEIKKS